MYREGGSSRRLEKGVYRLIYEAKEDKNNCYNNKGINSLSTISEIFAKIHIIRAIKVKEEIWEVQCGFIPG